MSDDLIYQLVSILQSIDTKLDSIENLLTDIKMDISGFSHQGSNYPGKLDSIVTTLDEIATNTSNLFAQ